MSLIDEIRGRIKQAMRDKNELEKDILRVALGDIQTIEARKGSVSEEEAQKVLRKIVASNTETMAAFGEDTENGQKLKKEIEILESFLPQMWDLAKIVEYLRSQVEIIAAIQAANADGPAVGQAMKALKAAGAPINGKDVSAAVSQIRNG